LKMAYFFVLSYMPTILSRNFAAAACGTYVLPDLKDQ